MEVLGWEVTLIDPPWGLPEPRLVEFSRGQTVTTPPCLLLWGRRRDTDPSRIEADVRLGYLPEALLSVDLSLRHLKRCGFRHWLGLYGSEKLLRRDLETVATAACGAASELWMVAALSGVGQLRWYLLDGGWRRGDGLRKTVHQIEAMLVALEPLLRSEHDD